MCLLGIAQISIMITYVELKINICIKKSNVGVNIEIYQRKEADSVAFEQHG